MTDEQLAAKPLHNLLTPEQHDASWWEGTSQRRLTAIVNESVENGNRMLSRILSCLLSIEEHISAIEDRLNRGS